MGIWENTARIVASDEVLPIIDPPLLDESPSHLLLATSADLHWRKQEWDHAISSSVLALKVCPNDFHVLTILATSLVRVGQIEAALPYARRMLEVKPPKWAAVKVLGALLGLHHLVSPRRRKNFSRIQRRIDEEAKSDRDHLMWAKDIVATIDSKSD